MKIQPPGDRPYSHEHRRRLYSSIIGMSSSSTTGWYPSSSPPATSDRIVSILAFSCRKERNKTDNEARTGRALQALRDARRRRRPARRRFKPWVVGRQVDEGRPPAREDYLARVGGKPGGVLKPRLERLTPGSTQVFHILAQRATRQCIVSACKHQPGCVLPRASRPVPTVCPCPYRPLGTVT